MSSDGVGQVLSPLSVPQVYGIPALAGAMQNAVGSSLYALLLSAHLLMLVASKPQGPTRHPLPDDLGCICAGALVC